MEHITTHQNEPCGGMTGLPTIDRWVGDGPRRGLVTIATPDDAELMDYLKATVCMGPLGRRSHLRQIYCSGEFHTQGVDEVIRTIKLSRNVGVRVFLLHRFMGLKPSQGQCVEHMCSQMHRLALELDVVLVLAVRCARPAPGERPTLGMMRGPESLDWLSAMVLACWRPPIEVAGVARVALLRNKHGSFGQCVRVVCGDGGLVEVA